ncbi:MAG: hypothetical protein JXA24_02305 [Proteobacteria bacterium]|nr:hypothetical protein [Pseudomonadota bacterium]
MKAPFFGTRIVKDIPLDEVEALLDKEALFASRWQFRRGISADEWEGLKAEKAIPIYERQMALVRAQSAIAPAIAYGYFECRRIGNGLLVKGERREFRFDFPRERQTPNRCIADLFGRGFAAFQLVTAGGRASEISARQFSEKRYSDSFYLRGLAAQFAEATAEFCQRMIRAELGAGDVVGFRFSPGYPAFPDLMDQRKIYELLGADRIGVRITETCQLIPEHSTSAIVSVDEEAAPFRP